MKHYGDITKIDGHKVEIPDVLFGGSPCQDLSVAGKREGLKGERSGLFMEQIRITKEMREQSERDGAVDIYGIRPRWFVWENVPGATSSGTPRGEDFRIVLEEIAKIVDKDAVIPRPPKDKWANAGCIILADGRGSIAWRIHDLQFWGIPQRRRRICVLADLNGLDAPKVLFERSVGEELPTLEDILLERPSLQRDTQPGEQEGEATPRCAERSVGEASGVDGAIGCDVYNQSISGEIASSITAASNVKHWQRVHGKWVRKK